MTLPPPPPQLNEWPARRVAILLSIYDGAPFLQAQLDSLVAQQGADWVLYWRDDGSSDASVAIMQRFACLVAARCVRADEAAHIGVTASYMRLLRAAMEDGATTVAFSDQDDVWLPDKLARGLAQIGDAQAHEAETPVLYCSRQVLVNAALRPLSDSARIAIPPGLGPALTQNIATGCTVMMNRAAAALVAASQPPSPSLHDWWSYLVVAAAGGRILADPVPTVLYRQHGHNAVGAPRSKRRRAVAALRRGPGQFMLVFRAQVLALQAQPGLLSPAARPMIDALATSLAAGPWGRLHVLRRYSLLRQTRAETYLFRLWFLFG